MQSNGIKILILGGDNEDAIERHYLKYLSIHFGVESVELMGISNYFNQYYHKNIINKIKYRIGLSRILRRINTTIRNKISDFKPDVLLVFKGMEIYPNTLRWVKSKNIKIVNYNPDNPFIFSGRGSGNNIIKKSLSLYDSYLSYDKNVIKELNIKYNINSNLLAFGYELSEDQFKNCINEPEIIKLCFIGNPDKHRVALLNKLAESNIPIDLYGYKWEKFKLNKQIKICGPLKKKDIFKHLRKYRVQLNIMRIHNLNSHNMRTFEIASVGGIQLAPHTIDHESFFTSGKEIFLYKNYKDCVDKIKFIMNLPSEKINEIRIDARKRCINSNYSYKEKTNIMFNYLNDLVKHN